MATPTHDQQGNAENFKFGIQSIRIGDGSMVDIGGPGSVTVVVGANNVGKSTLLIQIREILLSNSLSRDASPRVVTEVSEPWTGTTDDLEAWIRANSHIEPSGGELEHAVRPGLLPEDIKSMLALRRTPTPARLINWFVNHQTAGNRIDGTQAGRPQAGDAPVHPLQVLYKDRAKLDHLTRVVKRLFDFDLFLDTVGVNLLLRMGTPDVRPYLVSDFDPKYDHAVAALPQVQAQGDGIKSALGLLVPLISNFYPLVLLDEPEAHLHPPQARIIGEEIGNQARDNGSQVIVSTHDKNIVQGIVESKAPVTILHLKREGDTASAEVLNPEDIAELWKDPILRYGNALDGLFHSAVIVTEADRDSRFYEAAIDAARDATAPDSPAHNLMFIGSNGKQNMAKIVGRLRKLGVRTVSCPDLDILDDSNVLRNLIEAHDGKWEDFEPNYRKATNQFKGAPVPPSVDAVKANLEDLLDNAADETLTKPLSDAITKAVALPASKWRNLKDFGTDAFKDQKQAANALLDALDELGIVTVRKGVLENFLTTADARKGPEWIPVAFAENAHTKRAAAEQAGRVTQGRWHN